MQQRPDYQSGPSYKAEIGSTWPEATCITSFLISCIEPTIQRGMGPLQVNPLHLRVLKVDPRSQSWGWRKRRWWPMIVMHPPNPSLPCAHCPIHASQGGWEESPGHPHPHPVSTCICKGHPPCSSCILSSIWLLPSHSYGNLSICKNMFAYLISVNFVAPPHQKVPEFVTK